MSEVQKVHNNLHLDLAGPRATDSSRSAALYLTPTPDLLLGTGEIRTTYTYQAITIRLKLDAELDRSFKSTPEFRSVSQKLS